MSTPRHSEAAFEPVTEGHLPGAGYVAVRRQDFYRDRAIFPSVVRDFIRRTQPTTWARLEAVRGERTGEQVVGDLCKWMDAHESMATLRHHDHPTWWKKVKARQRGPVPKQVIEKKLATWAKTSPLQPHSGVAILELRRRLARAA